MSPSDGPKADATDSDDTLVTAEEPSLATEDTAAPESSGETTAEPSDEASAESSGETPVEPAGAVPVANRRKVLLFPAAAVVVLVVVGVVVYLLTRDDSSEATSGPGVPSIEGSAEPTSQAQEPPASSPSATAPQVSTSASVVTGTDAGAAQSLAEQAASAISSADVATLIQLSCDPAAAAEGSEETFPTDATVEVVGEPQISGDTASVDVRVTIPGAEPATVPMPLTKQGDRWCIP